MVDPVDMYYFSVAGQGVNLPPNYNININSLQIYNFFY